MGTTIEELEARRNALRLELSQVEGTIAETIRRQRWEANSIKYQIEAKAGTRQSEYYAEILSQVEKLSPWDKVEYIATYHRHQGSTLYTRLYYNACIETLADWFDGMDYGGEYCMVVPDDKVIDLFKDIEDKGEYE